MLNLIVSKIIKWNEIQDYIIRMRKKKTIHLHSNFYWKRIFESSQFTELKNKTKFNQIE